MPRPYCKPSTPAPSRAPLRCGQPRSWRYRENTTIRRPECQCRRRREIAAFAQCLRQRRIVGRRILRIEHAERADDDLLGRHARQNRHARLPVQAERFDSRLAPAPQLSQIGVFIVFDLRFARYGTGEITQEPDEERCTRISPPILRRYCALLSHMCDSVARIVGIR